VSVRIVAGDAKKISAAATPLYAPDRAVSRSTGTLGYEEIKKRRESADHKSDGDAPVVAVFLPEGCRQPVSSMPHLVNSKV
jgi:hypothetical protein